MTCLRQSGTLEIEEETVQLAKHDLMSEGYSRFIVLVDSINLEWENPERRPFFSGSLKLRFPFEKDAAHPWNKTPKIDAPLAKV